MELTKNELLNVTGGAINLGLLTAIGAAITFFAGIIDGYKPQCLHKRV